MLSSPSRKKTFLGLPNGCLTSTQNLKWILKSPPQNVPGVPNIPCCCDKITYRAGIGQLKTIFATLSDSMIKL